jgi:hypothetical protein
MQINFHSPLIDGVNRSDPRSGHRHLQASTPDLRVLIHRSHGKTRAWFEEIISYPCGNVGHAVAQLRHDATNRKVAGSIPYGATGP